MQRIAAALDKGDRRHEQSGTAAAAATGRRCRSFVPSSQPLQPLPTQARNRWGVSQRTGRGLRRRSQRVACICGSAYRPSASIRWFRELRSCTSRQAVLASA
jgi:hypothetical protein